MLHRLFGTKDKEPEDAAIASRQRAAINAQGAKVSDSPVASGSGITQKINSPTTFNLLVPTHAPSAPGSERYNEWRELTHELHESFRTMTNAFAYRPPPGIIDVEEREDYQDGIERGYRVLRNRILIADVLKNAGILEKFQKIAQYAILADTPRDASQRGCPTMVGFDLQVAEFENELMELARKDSGLPETQSLPTANTPHHVKPSAASTGPNIEFVGGRSKQVFISPYSRDGVCDPRTISENEKSVRAFVLSFENRPLSDRKITKAMNVIAKLRFFSENRATERRISYGVWLNSPCNSTTIGIGDTCELVLMCVVENQLVTFEDRRADGHSFHSDWSYIDDGSVEGLGIVEIILIEKNTQTTFKRTLKVWRVGANFFSSEAT